MRISYLTVKTGAVFLLLSNLHTIGFSQDHRYENLKVGELVPDTKLAYIENHKYQTSKLSHFKSKLLIIDFWATWCSPCVASFKKNDSLKKKFGTSLFFLPVTYEDSATVSKFMKHMESTTGLTPMTVVNDKLLKAMFNHTFLPHYVWLDENLKVIAITQGNDVNETNIATYLQEGKINYTLKVDSSRKLVKSPAFTPSIQIKRNQNIELEKLDDSVLIHSSILTNYVEGLPAGGTFRDTTYFSIRNATIAQLYKIALFGNALDVLNSSTVKVEIKDPELYKKVVGVAIDGTRMQSGLETLAWLRVHGYSYESHVPPILAKERFNIMKDELNRYFGPKLGINGVREKRKRKYLALTKISNNIKLVTKGGQPSIENDRFYLQMQNMNIESFKDRLAYLLQAAPPVINETAISENIDLEINCDLSDVKSLNKELSRYGLKLVEKEKTMDTGVIKQIK